jgi:hypothetical protein
MDEQGPEIEEARPARAAEVLHAGLRGTVGAMAMSGLREFTVHVGLVDQTPPDAIVKQRTRGWLLRLVPRGSQRVVVELVHWGYGAVGGAVFGLVPDKLRRRPWAGPAFGLLSWLGFELGLAPLIGLKQAKRPRPVERVALAGDHLLYGLVLSEMRPRPQE